MVRRGADHPGQGIDFADEERTQSGRSDWLVDRQEPRIYWGNDGHGRRAVRVMIYLGLVAPAHALGSEVDPDFYDLSFPPAPFRAFSSCELISA